MFMQVVVVFFFFLAIMGCFWLAIKGPEVVYVVFSCKAALDFC